MRLQILDSGHGLGTKALVAVIRAVPRQPVLDVVKLVKCRADFYGAPMNTSCLPTAFCCGTIASAF
jgi:hypothetical protein